MRFVKKMLGVAAARHPTPMQTEPPKAPVAKTYASVVGPWGKDSIAIQWDCVARRRTRMYKVIELMVFYACTL